MRSREEQEEFLERGRFGEGKQSLSRTSCPYLVVAGVLLILAGAAGSVGPKLRPVEALDIGYVLGVGSLVTNALANVDRTGIARLIVASALLIVVGGCIVYLPIHVVGGSALGLVRAMVGAALSVMSGVAFFVLGVIGRKSS